jgi:glycosyltransferase involved in cell wall biosynthesis
MEFSTSVSPSLIISTSDNSHALNLVLASAGRQSVAPREIFVVDESSDDQGAAIVEHWSHVLDCPVHRFASAQHSPTRAPLLNRTLRAVAGDYVIFIDGDCLLHRYFIADHLRHAAAKSFVQGRRAGVRARYVRRISPGRFHPILWFLRRRAYGLSQGLRRPWPNIRINDFRRIHGCNFAAWRGDLIRANGFNEGFDESGDEFLELAARLANAGLTLRTITGQAVVYHLDHRHVARYRSLNSTRILERTRDDGISRCDLGIASLPKSSAATTPSPAGSSTEAAPMKSEPASHFRDKSVPRSMLAPAAQRSR